MSEQKENNDNYELRISLTILIFAAVMAIIDLYGGKFGDDEIIAQNEKANVYDWFQSKSVKQSNLEGQLGILEALIESNTIADKDTTAIRKHMAALTKKIDRYEKQKQEILLGSAVVGEENWAQDIDGEMGKVKGAKEWEAETKVLGEAGDLFDFASLFLQISLVLGGIALIIRNVKLRIIFWSMMVISGSAALYYGIQAFQVTGML